MNTLNSNTYSLEFKLAQGVNKVEFYIICGKLHHGNMVQKCIVQSNV